MGALYRAGENKIRPGVYRRYEGRSIGEVVSAIYGVFAIPVKSEFGPLNEVTTFDADQVGDFLRMYGEGGTTDAAKALFEGGATKVHVYRLGEGGSVASLTVGTVATLKTKYPTERNYNVTIKEVLGDASAKQVLVYLDTKLLEKFNFAASADERAAFVEAVNKNSNYLVAEEGTNAGVVDTMANAGLTGGLEPTVEMESYSTAFEAFETLTWNYLVLDTCDTNVHALTKAYIQRIFEEGALGSCIIGEPTTVDFDTRCAHAKAFDNEKIIYLGSGYVDSYGNVYNGYYAIAKQAGIIGSLGSDTSATHMVIPGAAGVLESLKNSQYERAITSGMLLLSPSTDGRVWFDSGVNTLISLDENQDAGWKKIRRVATRFEIFDRIDRAVAPLIGRVNCDNIGIGDVIMCAQSVLDAMVSEGKLKNDPRPTFIEDPDYKRGADFAHFKINVDDLDSLEKIYLRYQFRFSAE